MDGKSEEKKSEVKKEEEKELAESDKEFMMTKDEEMERQINVDKKERKTI